MLTRDDTPMFGARQEGSVGGETFFAKQTHFSRRQYADWHARQGVLRGAIPAKCRSIWRRLVTGSRATRLLMRRTRCRRDCRSRGRSSRRRSPSTKRNSAYLISIRAQYLRDGGGQPAALRILAQLAFVCLTILRVRSTSPTFFRDRV